MSDVKELIEKIEIIAVEANASKGFRYHTENKAVIGTIIAKLRAGEKLCEAAKTGLLYMDHVGPLYDENHICGDPNALCDAGCAESAQWANDRDCIRKAIKDYEGA